MLQDGTGSALTAEETQGGTVMLDLNRQSAVR